MADNKRFTADDVFAAYDKTDTPTEPTVENVTTEETTTTEQPTIDGIIKDKFKSVEELNTFLSEHEELKNQVSSLGQTKTELETKTQTYEQKLKELEENGGIDDEQYSKLAALKKTNPEKAKLVEKILFGNPTSKDLLKLKIKQENPLYADKDELVGSIIEELYGVDMSEPDEDDFSTTEDYEKALKTFNNKKAVKQMKEEADSEGYKKSILSELESITIKKAKTTEEREKEQKDYIETWISPFKEIANDISEISFTKKGEDDKDVVLYNYKLTEEEKTKYLKPVAETIYGGRFKVDKETIEGLKVIAKKEFLYDNYERIFSELMANSEKKGTHEIMKKVGGTQVKNNEIRPQSQDKDVKRNAYKSIVGEI